jgi:hypothetical protein
MAFRTESALAGYARAAVDARIRMAEYTRTPAALQWAHIWRVLADLAAADLH